MERRLERAEGLLEFSRLPLGEIAKSCGFASPSHFARVFRRATGMTPGAWRRVRRQ
jgi:AraC family transcriptional regulator